MKFKVDTTEYARWREQRRERADKLLQRALEEAGLSIPEDVSLVSFNDTPLSELVTPALTSVSTHVEEMSRTAVRLLAERARVPGRPPVRTLPVKVVVPPSLVCRESVGVPAK